MYEHNVSGFWLSFVQPTIVYNSWTGNVAFAAGTFAMGTKFLTLFCCLKLLYLYTCFHLILTNNSLTIAHLTIQHHCFNKSVLIFVMLQFLLNQLFTFRVFPSILTTLNLYISETKKIFGTLSKLARRQSTSKFLFRRTKAK